MNNDLISREALKKAFEDTVCIEPMPYAFVRQIIDNAPTIDPIFGLFKEPHGKWISQFDYCKQHNLMPTGYGCFWWCNQCDGSNEKKTNYCPNCGAKMDGKEADNDK